MRDTHGHPGDHAVAADRIGDDLGGLLASGPAAPADAHAFRAARQSPPTATTSCRGRRDRLGRTAVSLGGTRGGDRRLRNQSRRRRAVGLGRPVCGRAALWLPGSWGLAAGVAGGLLCGGSWGPVLRELAAWLRWPGCAGLAARRGRRAGRACAWPRRRRRALRHVAVLAGGSARRGCPAARPGRSAPAGSRRAAGPAPRAVRPGAPPRTGPCAGIPTRR